MYVFDADSTLLKARADHDAAMVGRIALECNVSEDEVLSAVETYVGEHDGAFSIAGVVSMFEVQDPFTISIRVGEFVTETMADAAYPDTIDYLTELKERGERIAILTFGGTDYQMAKLKGTGIDDIVDHVVVVTEKDGKPDGMKEIIDAANAVPGDVTYVDDKEYMLETIRDRFSDVRLFHIDRQSEVASAPSTPEHAVESKFTRITELRQIPVA